MLESRNKQMYIDKTFYSLGTVNCIKIFGNDDINLMNTAIKRVYEIDDIMSAFKSNSDVYKINKYAGKKFVKISKDTIKVLNNAKKFAALTNGAFDVTIKPLVDLWGIGKKKILFLKKMKLII